MQYAKSITLMQHNQWRHKPTYLQRFIMAALLLSIGALSACSSDPVKVPAQVKKIIEKKEVVTKPVVKETQAPVAIVQQCDCQDNPNITPPPLIIPPAPKVTSDAQQQPDYHLLKPIAWDAFTAFDTYNLTQAWPAWQHSCTALINKPTWQLACNKAAILNTQYLGKPPQTVLKQYFQAHFTVHQTRNENGTNTGLITGYYQPALKGSRTQSAQFPYPLYLEPPDLITVKLDDTYPALKHKRIRGRLIGNKLVPYYTRAQIASKPSPINSAAFIYINDIIDVFFLQVQGSGLVELDTGEKVHVGYANQNGHAYRSIGRVLIKSNQLKASEASMAGIKNWARHNPDQLRTLLNSNPSFVFFRELPKDLPGPLGALGVPLLAQQAVAVDKRHIPLGAPIFLSTTEPNSNQPLQKMMMAQDTGGAIKGGVRADFYWGSGFEAGKKAGSMKQKGEIWVLLPKGFQLPN